MTAVATILGTGVQIRVGDGASPEVFTHPCLINAERAVRFQSQTNEEYIPDCDNPDLPAIKETYKTAVYASVSGSGKLNSTDLSAYLAWWNSDDAKNVRVYFGAVGYVQMAMKLTEFEVTGNRGGRAECNITLECHGAVGAFT